MEGLREKVRELHKRRANMSGRLNRIDRRIKTLDEHIQEAGYYREHKDVYAQYQQIKRPKKQAAFREQFYTGIALYEAAKRYF